MTIKQVCEKYGLTPDTLRYYEKIGVIPAVGRTSGGVRNYDDEAIRWVENAKCHGVTQKEIAAIIAHTAFYAGKPKGWVVFNLVEGDLENRRR